MFPTTPARHLPSRVHRRVAHPRIRAAGVVVRALITAGVVLLTDLTVISRGDSGQTNAAVTRTEGWRSDLDFLVGQIQRQHYVYRRTALPRAFVAGVERLTTELRWRGESSRAPLEWGDRVCFGPLPRADSRRPPAVDRGRLACLLHSRRLLCESRSRARRGARPREALNLEPLCEWERETTRRFSRGLDV